MSDKSSPVEQIVNWEFIPGVINHPMATSEIDENYGILRSKVPGGWLVATVKGGEEETSKARHYVPSSLCFLPDVSHAWDLETKSE